MPGRARQDAEPAAPRDGFTAARKTRSVPSHRSRIRVFRRRPMIQLKAQLTRVAAAHLYETPLSDDQTIEPLDADHVLVTATVRQSAQLEWWLRGFGSAIQVL